MKRALDTDDLDGAGSLQHGQPSSIFRVSELVEVFEEARSFSNEAERQEAHASMTGHESVTDHDYVRIARHLYSFLEDEVGWELAQIHYLGQKLSELAGKLERSRQAFEAQHGARPGVVYIEHLETAAGTCPAGDDWGDLASDKGDLASDKASSDESSDESCGDSGGSGAASDSDGDSGSSNS